MGVNKVEYFGKVLVDLTEDTVADDTLHKGVTAHDKSGALVTGTFSIDDEITTQDGLITAIKTALNGKAAGGGTATPTQEKTVNITETGTVEITPDAGYALSKVTAVVNVAGGSTEPDPRDQYQRVEYIESAEAGTYPYIITDIYADNDIGAEVVASFPAMADRIPMGSRLDSGSTRFYVAYPLSTSSCYYGFNVGASISCSTKVDTIYRLQTNFMNSRQAIIYEENGTRKAFGSFTQTLSKHTVPIAIFGYNSASSGAVTSKREYKLYHARISEGFDVIREYIPCYRKSDGVAGVYEKYTGTFLTSETGAFAKGADVEW